MIRTRLDRLRRLTGFRMNMEEFTDTPDERENLMIHLIRALGNEEAADKLQHECNAHRKRMGEWRYSLEEKRDEIEEHRTFFVRNCCQVINRELKTGADAFLEKDFLSHRFWIIVDSCLIEIGLRRLKNTEQSKDEALEKASTSTLEERVASYAATRPTLRFPPFANLSDNEQRLVEDVLKDQRGLKRRPELFSVSNATMYDRRYVAALRGQLHSAESLARARLEKIRQLERQLQIGEEELRADDQVVEDDLQSVLKPKRVGRPSTVSSSTYNERRRVAGELRDLAHELSFLPDRVAEYVANERKFSATRTVAPKPRFLEDIIMLVRGVSYDLTTLDLVDAGLCEIGEDSKAT